MAIFSDFENPKFIVEPIHDINTSVEVESINKNNITVKDISVNQNCTSVNVEYIDNIDLQDHQEDVSQSKDVNADEKEEQYYIKNDPVRRFQIEVSSLSLLLPEFREATMKMDFLKYKHLIVAFQDKS